jgi:two-component system, NarL family, nitrate/nitrite response regulator NarL
MRNDDCVKVLVVDDHLGIRRAIATLIDAEQPRMRCVGAAATPSEALARTADLQPHVIVLDINLDGDDGLLLIPALQRNAACTIVVLTGITDPHVHAIARRHGAHACLAKSAPAAELMAAILDACCAGAVGKANTSIRGERFVLSCPGPNTQVD